MLAPSPFFAGPKNVHVATTYLTFALVVKLASTAIPCSPQFVAASPMALPSRSPSRDGAVEVGRVVLLARRAIRVAST